MTTHIGGFDSRRIKLGMVGGGEGAFIGAVQCGCRRRSEPGTVEELTSRDERRSETRERVGEEIDPRPFRPPPMGTVGSPTSTISFAAIKRSRRA